MHNSTRLAALEQRAEFLWKTLKALKKQGGGKLVENYSKELEDIFFKMKELRESGI